MEEKILIKSEKYNVKKLFKVMVAIGVALSIIWIVGVFINSIIDYNDHTHYDDCLSDDSYDMVWDKYNNEIPAQYGYEYMYQWKKDDSYFSMNEYIVNLMESNELELTFECEYSEYSNAFTYAISDPFSDFATWFVLVLVLRYLLPVGAFAIIGALIYLWLNSYNLTVSDKRVSGEVLFGKKVDLPIDSVSATSIISLFKGVGVSTSSGRISFLAIKNSAEIHKVINDLLIKRQEEKSKNVAVASAPATDEADQLKKYKDLLDSGIITQEEFDAKKKQLLGL